MPKVAPPKLEVTIFFLNHSFNVKYIPVKKQPTLSLLPLQLFIARAGLSLHCSNQQCFQVKVNKRGILCNINGGKGYSLDDLAYSVTFFMLLRLKNIKDKYASKNIAQPLSGKGWWTTRDLGFELSIILILSSCEIHVCPRRKRKGNNKRNQWHVFYQTLCGSEDSFLFPHCCFSSSLYTISPPFSLFFFSYKDK